MIEVRISFYHEESVEAFVNLLRMLQAIFEDMGNIETERFDF